MSVKDKEQGRCPSNEPLYQTVVHYYKSRIIRTATVILPLAIDKLYSYRVPESMASLQAGCRVEVQFGSKKRYAGIVREILDTESRAIRYKEILGIIDEEPLVDERALKLWEWMADYYMCTLGEVMIAALPAILKMSSESVITATEKVKQEDLGALSDDEFLIVEALQSRAEISIEEVQLILQKKKVFPVIESLSALHFLTVNELLKDRYIPKKIEWVKLASPYDHAVDFDILFDELKRAPKQSELVLAFFQFQNQEKRILLSKFLKQANAKRTALNALVKKGIFEISTTASNRMQSEGDIGIDTKVPDKQQQVAIDEIFHSFAEKKGVLLQGVTGSGKTRVYVELIKEQLIKGGQVLYLLPEIALTTQLEQRLKSIFGTRLLCYHSRLNNQQRVDAWRLCNEGFPIILAARSGLFLPFKNLSLVIVDESHDSSYKQQNPAPRYHGRDVASVLASLHKAQLIMGSATPSLESIYNAKLGKISWVQMPERYGEAQMPKLEIVHLSKDHALDHDSDIFSQTLLEHIESALGRGKQVLLFQNRRGYAPLLLCSNCDWKAECINCDVSLTVHKFQNFIQCHYCNYKRPIPPTCPQCESQLLRMDGFGTQKVQQELKGIFPEASIDRLDYDNTRQKKAFQNIIDRFAAGETHILVGTQMISKGLDFEHVEVVGILQADRALFYPEFRASERGLQLLFQVSGRAGRRKSVGKVIVQTHRPENKNFEYLVEQDYDRFMADELEQRGTLSYPPYSRIIKITVRHKLVNIAFESSTALSNALRLSFGNLASGVAPNHIPRINNQYIFSILLKMPKNTVSPNAAKEILNNEILKLRAKKEYRSVRFIVDIDPV